MIDYHIIIPARLDSTRLARKLLRQVGDRTILHHTWSRAILSQATQVIVATDSEEIQQHVENFGGRTQLTDKACQSGTARVFQAADKIGLAPDTLIVNVQADEPNIDPNLIDQLAQVASANESSHITTPAYPCSIASELNKPNKVKLTCNKEDEALYFSRSLIPYPHRAEKPTALIHIGIYAYRLEYLRRFVSYAASPLEKIEDLEQLRALWHGDRIKILPTQTPNHFGVDTEEDLLRFTSYYTQKS